MAIKGLLRSSVGTVSRSVAGIAGGGGGGTILGSLSATTQTPAVGDDVTLTISISSVHGELAADDDTPADGGSLTLTWSETLEYQWRKDGEAISGATNATLAITGVDATDNASYSVLVADTRTGAARVFGPLSITVPNAITGSFAISSTTPAEGDTVSFSIALTSVHGSLAVDDATPADGGAVTFTWEESLSYQYLKDGVEISGATSPAYSIASVTSGDDGDYTLRVTDTRIGEVLVFGPLSVESQSIEPPPAVTLANVSALRTAGWDVPDPSGWYIDPHPTPAAIKAALKTPFLNDSGGDGICIKRLWLPDTLVSGQFDTTQMNVIKATANSMHRQAINAWWELQINGNSGNYATAMAAAKSAFNAQVDAKIASGTSGGQFTSFLVISNRCRDENTALLALDWIVWDDYTEFEAAFDKVKTLVERQIASEVAGGRNFRFADGQPGEGYFNTTHLAQSAFFVEAFLAMCVYGINPSGASHAWANTKLNKLTADPTTDAEATFSPITLHNALGLVSRNGGGREWGSEATGPGLGGYEEQWAFAAAFMLRAFDTATNSEWSLVDDNLYIKSRHRGLVVEEDTAVRKTRMSAGSYGAVGTFAGLVGGTTAGERYSWMLDRQAETGGLRVLRALAGPRPTAAGASGSFAERVGSRWCYRADMSQPSSTFRVDVGYRDIDCWRESGDERILSFCIGSVGLVIGHCNRAHPSGVLANGWWVGNKSVVGDPVFAASGWWAQGCHILPYISPIRATLPSEVADNSGFLIGAQAKPVLNGNEYSWSRDFAGSTGVYNGSAIVADNRFPAASSEFSLDTSAQVLTVNDSVTVDLSDGLYLGWHFSPSHSVTPITNGFEFGDGTDLIRVTIAPQGSFGLTRTIRTGATPFNLGSYNLDLEWHVTGNGGGLSRIAANVGYQPDTQVVDDVYEVTITIEANP